MEVHEQECVRQRFGDRELNLRARNVLEQAPNSAWLDGIEGVVIGGSGKYSVHHPASARWVNPLREVLELALHRTLPGFGVCFGHQLLGVHLGAEVVTDTARMESGTIALDRVEEDAVFGALPQRFFAHTGHTDLLTSVPPGTALLASTQAVPVQALRLDGAGWWTSQFHPDLTHAEARIRYGAFAKALAEEGGTASEGPEYTPQGDDAAVLFGSWFDAVFT